VVGLVTTIAGVVLVLLWALSGDTATSQRGDHLSAYNDGGGSAYGYEHGDLVVYAFDCWSKGPASSAEIATRKPGHPEEANSDRVVAASVSARSVGERSTRFQMRFVGGFTASDLADASEIRVTVDPVPGSTWSHGALPVPPGKVRVADWITSPRSFLADAAAAFTDYGKGC
jgi:hypothetical protein